MSGMAGLVRLDGGPLDADTLRGFRVGLPVRAGRGPRLWSDGAVALLRCCGPRDDAMAPAVALSTDGRLALLFDGRLSYRRDLARRLALPADLSSDAELAVAAFARWGDRALLELEGIDHALAVWDRRQRRLLLARAPTGWRALCWHEADGLLAFATEPRMLLNGLGLPRRPNEAAVAELLALRALSLTDTLWQNIHALPPGSLLDQEGGRRRLRHWHQVPADDSRHLSVPEHIERFRSLFDGAVIDCLEGPGVKLAQLSGGLDSSTVVMRASQLARDGRVEMPTVVVGRYPAEGYDEGFYSDAVIAAAGVRPVVVDGRQAYDWEQASRDSAELLSVPGRPSIHGAMRRTADLQSLDAGVMLTGGGGDEWLAGNYFYLASQIRQGDVAALLGHLLGNRLSDEPARRLLHLWRHGLRPLLTKAGRQRLRLTHTRTQPEIPDLLLPQWARQVGMEQRWQEAASAPPPPVNSLWGQIRYHNFGTPMQNFTRDAHVALLDQWGLQLRHPYYDPRLTRYLLEVPGQLLRRNAGGRHVTKWLLREATRGILPERVRTRTDKANFSSMIADAALARMADRTPGSLLPVRRGWVSAEVVGRLLQHLRDWQHSGRPYPVRVPGLGPLWSVIAVDVWLEQAGIGG